MNLCEFLSGEIRILVATIKLGMGFDKSDVRFVIHFNSPENLISYYQQIGRVGRDGQPSYAILLHGKDDESTINHFIKSTGSSPNLLSSIVEECEHGCKRKDLLSRLNVSMGVLNQALKQLMIHNYIYKDESTYRLNTGKIFDKAEEKARREKLNQAKRFYEEKHDIINPRKKWPDGTNIDSDLRMKPGWMLYADYWSEYGQKVKVGKYSSGEFGADLVDSSANFLKSKIDDYGINVVVDVPSLKHPTLVSDFAWKLAEKLGIDCVHAVKKMSQEYDQSDFENSFGQEENVRETTEVVDARVIAGRSVLLVDDMVSSRWTLTVIASKLLEAGAGSVYPFALVKTESGN